jgi:hypothetical protein
MASMTNSGMGGFGFASLLPFRGNLGGVLAMLRGLFGPWWAKLLPFLLGAVGWFFGLFRSGSTAAVA